MQKEKMSNGAHSNIKRDDIPGNGHRTGYQLGQLTKEKSLHKMQAE